MRRNLRLYWRALALLGALLSLFIDWPGLMVCVMPAIFLTPIASAAPMQPEQQQRQHLHTMENALPTGNESFVAESDFYNTTTNYHSSSINVDCSQSGSNNSKDDEHILSDHKDNFILNINLNTNQSNSHKYSKSEREQQKQQQSTHSTTHAAQSYAAANAFALAVNTSALKSSNDVARTSELSGEDAPSLRAIAISHGDQLQNAQRINLLNSILNKRKRQKFSDEISANIAHEERATSRNGSRGSTDIIITSSTTDRQLTASVADDIFTTTINTPHILSAHSISNKVFNKNNINNAEQQMAKAPTRTLSELETTTTTSLTKTPETNNYKTNINKIQNAQNYIETHVVDAAAESVAYTQEEEQQQLLNNMLSSTSASNDYPDDQSTSTGVAQSYTTVLPVEENAVLHTFAIDSIVHKPLPAIRFASAHHTVIVLSRTERSIREDASPYSRRHVHAETVAQPLIRHHGGSASIGIVRRSSDGGSPKTKRLNNFRNSNGRKHLLPSNLDRNERSTISHLSGLSRKIQIYIKNRFIQLLPDGTVNGTQDEQSDYTILQRSTVDVGRIKIQGVATCLYLCMDACGAVYGSKDFSDDCVFNENMEQHNYNTYSSTFNSNARRVYYLALNRHGEPRKLQIPPTRSLGKLATYTNAITETVEEERVEKLIAKNFGENRIKHGIRQLCDTGKPLIDLIDSKHFQMHPKCNPNSSNSHSNSNSSSNSSSNSNSSSSSSGSKKSNSGISSLLGNSDSDSPSYSNSSISSQSMNNVPAASERGESQSSTVTNSHSNHNRWGQPEGENVSSSLSNSNNSNSSSNSISNSTTTNNGSHSSNNNSQTGQGHQHHSAGGAGGGKKKKKRRKCRPHENDEDDNCQRSPLALRKRGNNLNNKKCREQLALQQQQRRQHKAKGEEVPDMPLPGPCKKKKHGGGGGGGGKKNHNKQNSNANKRNNQGAGDATTLNNRRGGKKMNANGRQGGGGGGNGNGGANRKRARNGGGGGAGAQTQKKQKKHLAQGQKTTSSTETTSSAATATTTQHQISENTTVVATLAMPHTTTEFSSAELVDPLDTRAEVTSVRVEREREQRNVHYTNSMENDEVALAQAATLDKTAASEVTQDFIGSREDYTEANASEEEAHDEDDDVGAVGGVVGGGGAVSSDEDDADDISADDDMYDDSEENVAAAPPVSSAAAAATVALRARIVKTARVRGGEADDFLYYDQFDFFSSTLWKLLSLFWLAHWTLQKRT
ncbi:putative uncharacterized protein DDB_G0277255 [Eurosta solidaginis]|uniref:putative uncharacterized protein DDB_G0277255 n=1 Tax=Eurosta solidaginis TaxID=178769 RepID=UPI0035306949